MDSGDFRVVVIDDKLDVCRTIAEKLDGLRGGDDPDVRGRIAVKKVHIQLERENRATELMEDSWRFSNSVLEQLDQAAQSPAQLVIVDYFYVDPEVAKVLKSEAKSIGLSQERLFGRVLSPHDLRQWVEGLGAEDSRRRRILENVFGASCAVYLHSYTPEGMTALAGPVQERRKGLARVFSNAQVVQAIDTRREFFRDEVFDWPNEDSKYDGKYYPYQLAVYFDQVLEKEVLRKQLSESRYLKIRRSATAVASISAIGGGVGLASAWIGDYVADAFRDGDLVLGLAIGSLLLFGLFALGIACPFMFERYMNRLIRDRERDSA